MRMQSTWTELWKEQSFLHYQYLSTRCHFLAFHVHWNIFLDNNFKNNIWVSHANLTKQKFGAHLLLRGFDYLSLWIFMCRYFIFVDFFLGGFTCY